MDRKTRRSLKKAQMATAAVSEKLEETQDSLENTKIELTTTQEELKKTKTDLETQKASISQLEANTEVLMTKALPPPTPEPKNAPVTL